MKARRVSVVLLLLAAGCGVVKVQPSIEVGRGIRIDPCSLVGQGAVDAALGGPAERTLEVAVAPKPGFGSCTYARPTPEARSLRLTVGSETKDSIDQLNTGIGFTTGTPVADVGRQAASQYRADEGTLALNALSMHGVHLHLELSGRGEPDSVLLTKATTLSHAAVDRIESVYPGTATLPRDTPPTPPCKLVSAQEMVAAWTGVRVPKPVDMTITFTESETFTSPGGTWTCEALMPEGVPNVWWTVHKSPAPSAQPVPGEALRGVGAWARWNTGCTPQGAACNVLVLTGSARLLSVATCSCAPLDAASRRTVALKLAAQIAPRLA